jgi:hypothetical protein
MNYIEYVHAEDPQETEAGSLWTNESSRDIWIFTDIGPTGFMVRLKDGKFHGIPDCGYDLQFTRFRGHLTINTEA